MRKILITGAAGGLGKIARKGLEGWADKVLLSDIVDIDDCAAHEEFVKCPLGDLAAVTDLLDGVDGVVHLGGMSVENTFETILDSNLRGTYNLFEAARKTGSPRILFASSNHAIGFHTRETKLDGDSKQKPDSLYGVSKCFGENLASYYFDKFGVESVSVRIGSCFPKPADRRMMATWLSPDDFIALVKAIFEAPRTGAAMVYGVSDNRECWWDNTHARFLGWRPKDSSEQFRAEIEAQPYDLTPDHPAVKYQGGGFAAAGHFED